MNFLRGRVGRPELVDQSGEMRHIPSYQWPAIHEQVGIELGDLSEFQLYNLEKDKGQQKNLAVVHKDKIKEMIGDFDRIRGRNMRTQKSLSYNNQI